MCFAALRLMEFAFMTMVDVEPCMPCKFQDGMCTAVNGFKKATSCLQC